MKLYCIVKCEEFGIDSLYFCDNLGFVFGLEGGLIWFIEVIVLVIGSMFLSINC